MNVCDTSLNARCHDYDQLSLIVYYGLGTQRIIPKDFTLFQPI